VDVERLTEPVPGRRRLTERGVQQTDPVRVGAHEAHQGAVDRAGVGHRQQIVEQLLTQWTVVERDRRRDQFADEDRPEVRPVGAPVVEGEHGVQLAPGGVEVPGPGVEPGRDRVGVRGHADPPAHGFGGGGAQLGGVGAGPHHLEAL